MSEYTFKVIIAGSRTFTDYAFLKKSCEHLLQNKERIEIVSGGARGTDKLGERFAKEKEYGLKVFNADWNTFGKSAGVRRNKEMANYANALIAFWDGKSKGTKHMIDFAKEKGLNVRVKYFR